MFHKRSVRLLCLASLTAGCVCALASPGGHRGTAARLGKNVPAAATGSGAFVENRGQWDGRATFMMSQPGVNFWVTQDGPVLDFRKLIPATAKTPKTIQGNVVSMKFINSRTTAIRGSNQVAGVYNYFIGNDNSKWVTGARRFSTVSAE